MGALDILTTTGFTICNTIILNTLGKSEAIFLGELCKQQDYWKNINKLDNEGYFFISREIIEEHTGLKRKKQWEITNTFINLNFINTKTDKSMGINFYKVNEHEIQKFISKNTINKNMTMFQNETCHVSKRNINNNINNNKENNIINNIILENSENPEFSQEENQPKTFLDKIERKHTKGNGSLVTKKSTAKKTTAKERFKKRFCDVCAEFTFSDIVLDRLENFADYLAEYGKLYPEDTIRQQLGMFEKEKLSDSEILQVIDTVILNGWQSLVSGINSLRFPRYGNTLTRGKEVIDGITGGLNPNGYYTEEQKEEFRRKVASGEIKTY